MQNSSVGKEGRSKKPHSSYSAVGNTVLCDQSHHKLGDVTLAQIRHAILLSPDKIN